MVLGMVKGWTPDASSLCIWLHRIKMVQCFMPAGFETRPCDILQPGMGKNWLAPIPLQA